MWVTGVVAKGLKEFDPRELENLGVVGGMEQRALNLEHLEPLVLGL